MEMTQNVEQAIDDFKDWAIDCLGLRNYEEDLKNAEQEGELKERVKTVINMFKRHYTINEISIINEISEAEILQIAKDHNLTVQ